MVDSILDNLSLRTQRRGDLRLELSLETSTEKLDQVIERIKKFLDRKEIEDANVILSEIATNAIVVVSDYYTAPVTMKEFNFVKQEINMQTLKMLEEMQVELAGSSNSIRIVGDAR
jgi:MscS family membrane protein